MRTLVTHPLTVFALACAFTLAFLFPVTTFSLEFPRTRPSDIHERLTARFNSGLQGLCDRLQSSRLPLLLPDFCTPPPPPPPPPPVDVCPNVPGDQETGPCADDECALDGGIWNGESCDMPPPPLVYACPNVPGDQENGPCADETCVEDGGTWNGVSCDLPPPPEETIGHVVISEVHYNVDVAHGVNTTNDNNEWVELYNGTNETVDLSGWTLTDNDLSDALPAGTLFPSGAFLIVTATTSTSGFWPDIPEGVEVVVLGSQIGNGVAAGGDVVLLRDTGVNLIDAVSWGTNTAAFNPSVSGVAQGESIARILLTVDTDTAADWEMREIPSPGLADVPLSSSVPETL